MIHTLRQLAAAPLLILALAAAPAAAGEAGGVRFDERATVAGDTLTLNGAGVRTRLMFKVYAMGLYLPARTGDAATALATSGARRLHLVLLRDLEAAQFADALIDGLANNHGSAQLAALQPAIDSLRSTLQALGKAPKGTVVQLDAVAGGTRLSINGQPRGADIADAALFPALMRIWLGDQPADAELKRALLGAGD